MEGEREGEIRFRFVADIKKFFSELHQVQTKTQNTASKTASAVNSSIKQCTNSALKSIKNVNAVSSAGAKKVKQNISGIENQSKSTALGMSNAFSGAFKNIALLAGGAFSLHGMVNFTKSCIDLGSELQEVQNVVDVTFSSMSDKVNKFASTAIESIGLSETVAKNMMGTYGVMSKSFGFTEKQAYEMSETITSLTADVASFYNLSTDEAYTKMTSIWTGETESLKELGVILTQAALDQYALSNGYAKTTAQMTEQEKVMLRYQYVQSRLAAASGDFARTSGGWANQTRVLTLRFQQLKATLGQGFINLFTPIVKMLNTFIAKLQSAANTFLRLTEIITGKESGSMGNLAADTTAVADAAGSASDSLSDMGNSAADAAKKALREMAGFDKITKLSENDTSSSGSGGSSGVSSGSGGTSAIAQEFDEATKAATKLEKQLTEMVDKVKEAWKTGDFTEIGSIVADQIDKALKGIEWTKIKETTKNVAKSIATLLNGALGKKSLWETTGSTVAECLNTALEFLYTFGDTFEWEKFGNSIATGINNFFETTDLVLAADTINTWVDGLEDALISAIKNLNYSKILGKVTEFLTELDLDTVMIAIGTIAWKYKGKELLLSTFGSILASEMSVGIGDLVISKGATLGISVATAIAGFKIGNALYENIPTVQQIADSLVEWIFKDGKEIAVAKTISVALTGLSISLSTVGIISVIKTAITGAITTASAEASLAGTGVGAVILGKIGTAITTATGALSTLGSTIIGGIGTALSNAGTFLTSGVSTVFAGGAASIAAGLFAAIGAAIGGWNIGKLIYEKFSEQIDSIVFAIGDFFTKTIPEALSKAGNAILDFTANIKGNLDESFTNAKEKFLELKDQTVQKLIEAKEKVAGKFDEWKGKFDDFKTNTAQKLIETKEAVSGKLKEWKTNFDNFKSDTAQKLIETKEKVNGEFSQWKDKFDDFKNNTAEKVIETKEAVSGKFDEWKTNFDNFVGNTISKVVAAKEDAGSTFSTWKNEFDNFKDDYVVKTALAIGNFDNNAREIKDWFDEKTNDTKNLLAKGVAEGKEKIESIKGAWDEIKEKTKKLIAKGSQTGQSALEGIKKVWNTIKEKTKKLKTEGSQTGKKTLSSVKQVWDGITAGTKGIKTKFSGIKSDVLEKVSNAWNSIQEKAKELSVVFNDNFTAPLKRAWNAIARSINTFVDKIPYVGSKIADVPTFAGYATGGFPEDGWFRASHGEIMGKFDNGQSVVANNMQITKGISNAVGPSVYQAVRGAMSQSMAMLSNSLRSISLSIPTPTLSSVQTSNSSDRTLDRILEVVMSLVSGEATGETLTILKEILVVLKEMDNDIYMDAEKVTKKVVEVINRHTDVSGTCEIKV